MRGDYLCDYGGPMVNWPGDSTEPDDWAALYPVPASKLIDRPSKRRRQRQQAEDSEDDSDDGGDDFWLSPRMACRLHAAGCFYVDEYCRGGDPDCVRDDMPGVVQPYAKGKQWMEAYEQAAMRLVRRFEKGLEPQPNCTAEEFALHKIIQIAQELCEDGCEEGVQETMEQQKLPRSTRDEDFDFVSDVAFQDHDVLMLFNMPQLIHPSAITQMMGTANLHPQDWFKPFKPNRICDHV